MQLTIASSQGAKKKGGGELTVFDFLPDWVKPKKKLMSAEERENQLKAFLKAAAERSKQKELNG